MLKNNMRCGLLVTAICLLSLQTPACLPPCLGCQTRNAYGNCVDDDSQCPHFCLSAQCVECEEHEHCPSCKYCNASHSCAQVTVTYLNCDSEVLCVGQDNWFSATTVPGGFACHLTWQFEGAAESASICGGAWARWTNSGTYTVTVSCGSNSLSKTIKVVEVSEVQASKTAICWNDPEGIIFTAIPDPVGAMNCLVWNCRFKTNQNDDWSSWGSWSGQGATWRLDPDTWNGPGLYQFRARNGTDDTWKESEVIKAVRVDLQAQPHVQPNSPLVAGRICANAQEAFRKAPWKAVVKPGGTTASISVSGPVSGAGSVGDNEIFYVESTDENAVGDYTVTLTHDDCGNCPVTKNETVFKFFVEEGVHLNSSSSGATEGAVIGTNGSEVHAPKDGPETGVLVAGWVQRGKYVLIKTYPDPDAYFGNVRKSIKYSFATDGSVAIQNLYQPRPFSFPEINVSWLILSISIPLGGDNTEINYGSSVAGINGFIRIGEDQPIEYGQLSFDHNDVGIPQDPWQSMYEIFDTSLGQTVNDENRLYTVNSPLIAKFLVSVGSNAKKSSQSKYQTVIDQNSQWLNSMIIEPLESPYEIPIP